MCKRPFKGNGNLNTCIYKVSVYAFIPNINSYCCKKSMCLRQAQNKLDL